MTWGPRFPRIFLWTIITYTRLLHSGYYMVSFWFVPKSGLFFPTNSGKSPTFFTSVQQSLSSNYISMWLWPRKTCMTRYTLWVKVNKHLMTAVLTWALALSMPFRIFRIHVYISRMARVLYFSEKQTFKVPVEYILVLTDMFINMI